MPTTMDAAIDDEVKRTTPAGTVSITMRFPENVHKALTGIAAREHISFNGLVMAVLHRVLQEKR